MHLTTQQTLFLKISYSELWLRVNYYGLQSLLVIYLVSHFHITNEMAYAVYGTFAALVFGFGMVGGIIADKFIGHRYALLLGSLLLVMGNGLLLLFNNLSVTFSSTSIIILGLALLKPANSCLLGMNYENNTEERSKAFSIFYLIANVGGMIGPLCYGLGIFLHHDGLGFVLGGLGILSTTVMLYFTSALKLLSTFKNTTKNTIKACAIILLCIVIADVFIAGILSLGDFIAPILIILFFYMLTLYKNTPMNEKHNIFALALPMIASILCFAFILQLYSSVMIFIQLHLNFTLLGNAIPATWFSTLEALFVLLCIPVLRISWRWLEKCGIKITEQNKIFVGLFILSLSFFAFALAALSSIVVIVLAWIVAANFLLAMAEMSVIPPSIALISKLSPKQHQGKFMGLFYFSLLFSGYLSGKIAEYAPVNAHGFSFYFSIIALLLVGMTVLLAIIIKAVDIRIING